jgi:hypothetical protein
MDPFAKKIKTIDSVAENAYAITPADDADLPRSTRSIYVGGAGDVNVVLANDDTNVIFVNVAAGSVLPIRVKKVLSTDTTATDLVALL